MNMRRHLLNGLTTIGMIVFCSFALNANGQTTTSEASSPATVEAAAIVPNTLPITLPLTRIEHWAVTNVLDRAVFDHYIFVYSLLYKDSTGKYLPPRTISVPGYGFKTYDAYRSFAVSNIMNLKADIEVDPLYMMGNAINYRELVRYTTPKGKQYTGLSYNQDLGSLTKMTPEAIYNLRPTYKAFVLGIKDLKMVKINRVGVYENTWVVNGGWAKNYPSAEDNAIPGWENGNTNIVSLNSWYLGDHNTAITIEAGNSRKTYYGTGQDGSKPCLELKNPKVLKVFMPSGANVSVEVSSDMRYWSPLALLPSSEEEQIITLDLEQYSDPGMTLFQAKIY